MKQWDGIFKEYGKVFLKPQMDVPKIARLFKKREVKRLPRIKIISTLIFETRHPALAGGGQVINQKIKRLIER